MRQLTKSNFLAQFSRPRVFPPDSPGREIGDNTGFLPFRVVATLYGAAFSSLKAVALKKNGDAASRRRRFFMLVSNFETNMVSNYDL